jgi:thymidylate synthase (FAD)
MRKVITEAESVLGVKYRVLDHGHVGLVDYMGGDEAIDNFARVSYGEGTRKTSERAGLIRYLVRKRHSSPLESTELAFNIACPIHVARQIVRHRTASMNEYSARYSIVPEVIYDDYSCQAQSDNNKQGRSSDLIDRGLESCYKSDIREIQDESFKVYRDMVKSGVAREIARMHLPLNTYTYFFWKMDLGNLFKFLSLRLDLHAQYEVRQFAHAIGCLTRLVAPIAFDAFVDYELDSVRMTSLDMRLLELLSQKGYNCIGAEIGDQLKEFIQTEGKAFGMGKREIAEFLEKISCETLDRDFSLNSLKVINE